MKIYQIVALIIISLSNVTSMADGGSTTTSEPVSMTTGDIAAGEQISAGCVGCHGADGNGIEGNGTLPKLAGQHAEYLILQLNAFKQGNRVNEIMQAMVETLTEQNIKDLAAFYSSKELTVGKANPELVELGAKIYRAGNADSGVPACAACHGPRGTGNPVAQYPSLSAQHAAYVETQLTAFQSGARQNTVMHTIAAKMTDEEIKAVADFIQGLH